MSILQSRSQRAGTGILYSGGRWKIDGATQANQEAEAAGKVVTSDVQHFGPSAIKAWAYVTVSAGTPTIQASYNITSITDAGVGLITFTIATDFSSVNWVSHITAVNAGATGILAFEVSGSKTVTAVQFQAVNASTLAAADPSAWSFTAIGDQ